MVHFMYGPDGESKLFDSEDDAPKGWKDHPPKVNEEPEERRRSRVELMAELRQRGVQYAPQAGGAELAALLAISTNDMASLRAAYVEKIGKKPFMGWDEATLREKIASQ